MSDQLHERVSDVLDRADAGSGSVLSRSADESESETDDASTDDVLEAAADANEILEEADPDALLEAVGLDTLPDGTEPDSIPAAIAQGEPEDVEALQRLLHLAKLADRGGDDLEGAVGELRDRIGDAESEDGAGTDDADAETESGSTDDADAETESGSTDDADAADDAGGEPDDDAATTDDLADRLRSSMESSLGAFSDDIEGLQSKLEEATAGMGSGSDDGTADAADADADEADADVDDEAEDDGLLDADFGGEQDRDTSTGGATRHSTMAPPPSERADMRGTARHSTMPDRH